MPDFKAMYYELFNKVTDATNILQNAQLDGEEAYISSDDTIYDIPWSDENKQL